MIFYFLEESTKLYDSDMPYRETNTLKKQVTTKIKLVKLNAKMDLFNNELKTMKTELGNFNKISTDLEDCKSELQIVSVPFYI